MTASIPANCIKKTITYFYSLSFCPASHFEDFIAESTDFRKGLAKEAVMPEKAFFPVAISEICRRIVSFNSDSRVPDQDIVIALEKAATKALKNQDGLIKFQEEMLKVASLPGRAKIENRLHRKKGCKLCLTPCRYGYYTLVSEPKFSVLQKALEDEVRKEKSTQKPVQVIWTFVIAHLMSTFNSQRGHVVPEHLGNLGYCLLMLSTAKSRYPLPEKQVSAFQEANQKFIQLMTQMKQS
jgi:hypothetical protein